MVNRGDTDWDDAFANMAHVPGSENLPETWAKAAQDFRDSHEGKELDIAYGDNPRERYDLFWPEGNPKGTFIFIHGGYWLKFDKNYWSHFAKGALEKGWSVAMASYTLAPEARICHMTQQTGQAIAAIAGRMEGPLRLAGHSAGGHLVSRMVCDDTPLTASILARIEHVMAISGLFDLEPLMWTAMNKGLRLDDAEARSESAIHHQPVDAGRFTAWVGGGERPEFIRQSREMAQIWPGTRLEIEGNHNHFTIIEGLKQGDSAIIRSLLD